MTDVILLLVTVFSHKTSNEEMLLRCFAPLIVLKMKNAKICVSHTVRVKPL